MSNAYDLATLTLANITRLRILGGPAGNVIASIDPAFGNLEWVANAGGGGGGPIVTDGESILGNGTTLDPLTVGRVAGGTFTRGANR